MDSPKSAKLWTMGALAKRTGVSVSAIRYYEAIGLIATAARRPSGHRVYGDDVEATLTLVRNCREFGFSIDQIRALLALSFDPAKVCNQTRDIAQKHLNAVQAKLAQLRQLEASLQSLVQKCTATCLGGPATQCSILEDVAKGEAQQSALRACC